MIAYERKRFDNTILQPRKYLIIRQIVLHCKLDTMAIVIIAYHSGLK